MEQKIDGGQIQVANNENQSCLQRGILGYVPPLNDDDIQMVHIPEHLAGIAALVKKGEVMGWDEMDIAGFQSLGQHLNLHMDAINNNPNAKQMANQVNQAMQGLIRQAQEFVNNFQKAKEAEEQQPDPIAAGKLQLDAAKFKQGQVEHQDLKEHRAESLDVTKAKAGVASKLQLRQQDIQIAQGEQKDQTSREKGASADELKRLQLEQQAAAAAQAEEQQEFIE